MVGDINLGSARYWNKVAAHAAETQEALEAKQAEVASAARAVLARHRKTGTHEIVESRGAVDRYVSLEGPAAAAVEYGHFTKDGRFIEGIHSLTGGI